MWIHHPLRVRMRGSHSQPAAQQILMRVLQLIDSLPLAGAEVLVKDVAPRLRKRGIECEVAVLRRLHSPLESMLQDAGVPLHSTGVPNLYSPRQSRSAGEA